MMMVTIRNAVRGDIPELADLLGELFTLEREFSPDRTSQIRGLIMLFDRGDAVRIMTAEREGRIIGLGVLHYTVSTYLGAKVAVLEDVVVTAGERGKGTGSRLMAGIIEQARADGVSRITLLTDHDNSAAQSFYESFGFVRSTMVPHRLMLQPTLSA
jgi:N-acetylglutamate synthase-like GNAT family acetyltransferase